MGKYYTPCTCGWPGIECLCLTPEEKEKMTLEEIAEYEEGLDDDD